MISRIQCKRTKFFDLEIQDQLTLACVLTATLWSWTRGCLFYVIPLIFDLSYFSIISMSLNDQTMKRIVNLIRNINITRVENHKVAVRTHASKTLSKYFSQRRLFYQVFATNDKCRGNKMRFKSQRRLLLSQLLLAHAKPTVPFSFLRRKNACET